MHIRWRGNTLRILKEIFGTSSRYYLSMSLFSWNSSKTMFITDPWNASYEIEQNHQYEFINELSQLEGLLLAAKDQLAISTIDEVLKGNNSLETSDIINVIDLIEQKLRKTIRTTPTSEREIQDFSTGMCDGAQAGKGIYVLLNGRPAKRHLLPKRYGNTQASI